MKRALFFFILLHCAVLQCSTSYAQQTPPDTVRIGIYITSIHDIDFKQKEYAVNLWLWIKYKNPDFDFSQNLEIPQAKNVVSSYSTADTTDGEIYLLMKLQCVMKDSWRIDNFPFDHQTLRFSFENSQYDSKALVFAADTSGENFDPRFTLRGWTISKLDITNGIKKYETAFGDNSIVIPHTEYSNFKVKIMIDRDAMGLFWKMFLGMYIAFLIAFMCFYIHIDGIDSRFGLSVGALFAVIGNKYIIDSALPESTTFTLVDMLHGITLVFILVIIVCNALALKFFKQSGIDKANRFDAKAAKLVLGAFIVLNVFFIWQAATN